MFYFITILLVKSHWPLPMPYCTGIPHSSHLTDLDPSRLTLALALQPLRLTGPLPREQVPSADFRPGLRSRPPGNPYLTSQVNQPKHLSLVFNVNNAKKFIMWPPPHTQSLPNLFLLCCGGGHQIVYSLVLISSYGHRLKMYPEFGFFPRSNPNASHLQSYDSLWLVLGPE